MTRHPITLEVVGSPAVHTFEVDPRAPFTQGDPMAGTHWRVLTPHDPDIHAAFERAQYEEWEALGVGEHVEDFASPDEAFAATMLAQIEESLELYGHDMDPELRAGLEAERAQLRGEGAPGDPPWRVAMRRHRERQGPHGFGSILDMDRVDEAILASAMHPRELSANHGSVRIARPDELADAYGSGAPTLAEIEAAGIAALACAFGEGVAHPVFDEQGRPVSWLFEGISGL